MTNKYEAKLNGATDYLPQDEGMEMVKKYDGQTVENATIQRIFEEEDNACWHVCSGNCRRVGCNCECGEWHNLKEEETAAQLPKGIY